MTTRSVMYAHARLIGLTMHVLTLDERDKLQYS
jgi:hypothetical protein